MVGMMEKAEMNPQPASAEQAADFAALNAAALEETQPSATPGAPSAPPVDEADSWAILPQMIGSILSPVLPELAQVYTPAACKQWGAAMVPVANKYGWKPDAFLGPEVALIGASLPLLIPTVVIIRAKRAAPAEQNKPAEDGAKPAADVPPADAVGQERPDPNKVVLDAISKRMRIE